MEQRLSRARKRSCWMVWGETVSFWAGLLPWSWDWSVSFVFLFLFCFLLFFVPHVLRAVSEADGEEVVV